MGIPALIIEDDEDLADIFAEALRGIGYEVEHVADGQKAKDRLVHGAPPYLILLDMHLPHISGGELLTTIIKKDERFEKTLVIITTADARMGEAYGDQVDFVMIKPISFVQLRDLTARLIPKE
ncbi:response regulator transcription factor [Chloroflexi bacterium CFX6]|nr:response regulator transcription factor [Chloroflexi bacterium CFX6]